AVTLWLSLAAKRTYCRTSGRNVRLDVIASVSIMLAAIEADVCESRRTERSACSNAGARMRDVTHASREHVLPSNGCSEMLRMIAGHSSECGTHPASAMPKSRWSMPSIGSGSLALWTSKCCGNSTPLLLAGATRAGAVDKQRQASGI